MDRVFSERITPARALCRGWGVWGAVYLLAPVDPRWPSDAVPVLLLLACILSMAAGIGAIGFANFKPPRLMLNPAVFKTLMRFVLGLGILGIAARLVDLYVFRAIGVISNVADARAQIAQAGSNPASLVAAAFGPMSIASLLIAGIGHRNGLAPRIGPLPVEVAMALPLISVLTASRSALIEFSMFAFVASLLLLRTITKRHIAIFVAAAILLVVFFNLLFTCRIADFGVDARFVSRYSVFTELVPAKSWFLDLQDSSGPLEGTIVGLMSLIQYILSPVFEYFYLVELKSDNFQNGAYEFFFIPKLAAFFTGQVTIATLGDQLVANPRTGVFQTFFGDSYVDFGFFSTVYVFAYGCLAMLARASVKAGNLFMFPFYTAVLVRLLTSPNHGMAGAAMIGDCTLLLLGLSGGMAVSLRQSKKSRGRHS